MDYLLGQAVENAPVVVAPPVLHGWMPAFRDFPGTNIADPVAFQDYMLELSRSLVKQGAQRLVSATAACASSLSNTSCLRKPGTP